MKNKNLEKLLFSIGVTLACVPASAATQAPDEQTARGLHTSSYESISHETNNLSAGDGGCIVTNNPSCNPNSGCIYG